MCEIKVTDFMNLINDRDYPPIKKIKINFIWALLKKNINTVLIIILMSKTLCEHLLQLRLEKVANFFSKAGKYCTGNKKHSACNVLGMCLSCGEVRCDG